MSLKHWFTKIFLWSFLMCLSVKFCVFLVDGKKCDRKRNKALPSSCFSNCSAPDSFEMCKCAILLTVWCFLSISSPFCYQRVCKDGQDRLLFRKQTRAGKTCQSGRVPLQRKHIKMQNRPHLGLICNVNPLCCNTETWLWSQYEKLFVEVQPWSLSCLFFPRSFFFSPR